MEDVKIAAQATLALCAILLGCAGLLVLIWFLATTAPWILILFIPLFIFGMFYLYIKLQ